jgi:small nuclear ribonucleoprotein (snRNP)-like protein
MCRKSLSLLAMISVLLISTSLVFANKGNDWSEVERLVNQEVAVKTRSGTMIYGIISSADSTGLVLRVAGNKVLTNDEITINRSEIKKIWRALLFINQTTIGKSALIGAGIGAGIGLISVATVGDNDPLAGAAVPLLAIVGAAAGGVAGVFARQKHKKRDLVFRQ